MLKNYLNELNEIKTVETIKYKKCTPGHKELLNLFDDLFDIILTNKTLMSSKDKKENENENENESENEDENENENENEDQNEDENENDDIIKILIHSNEYDEKTINQNKNNKIIKKIDDHLNEIIDKSKSFKEQIKSLKELKDLNDYYDYKVNDFGNKELKSKIFKLKLAHLSNEIDENLFEQIFDHKFEALANKLINTTNKEENQIIVDSIKKNKYKLYEKDKYDFLIQSQQRANLAQVINFILDFNEEFNYENENEDNENGNKNENKDNENKHENENEENEKLRKEYENENPPKKK